MIKNDIMIVIIHLSSFYECSQWRGLKTRMKTENFRKKKMRNYQKNTNNI